MPPGGLGDRKSTRWAQYLSLCLLTEDQDVKFSATVSVLCLSDSHTMILE